LNERPAVPGQTTEASSLKRTLHLPERRPTSKNFYLHRVLRWSNQAARTPESGWAGRPDPRPHAGHHPGRELWPMARHIEPDPRDLLVCPIRPGSMRLCRLMSSRMGASAWSRAHRRRAGLWRVA